MVPQSSLQPDSPINQSSIVSRYGIQDVKTAKPFLDTEQKRNRTVLLLLGYVSALSSALPNTKQNSHANVVKRNMAQFAGWLANYVSGLSAEQKQAPGGKLKEFTMIRNWIPKDVADTYKERVEAQVPFAKKRWNGLFLLPQKAYVYDSSVRKRKPIPALEDILQKLEQEFGVKILYVWCNKFEKESHHIQWHQDQYGAHLFVLSFGETGKVVFRDLKSKAVVQDIEPEHGDLYYFAPTYDKVNEHCVPKLSNMSEPRMSFAILTTKPKYIPE